VPRKQPRRGSDKPERKYFVPVPVKKPVPESPVPKQLPVARKVPVKVKVTDTGAKYFQRTTPLPSELDEIWRGKGPELPPGYKGAEACPDCSAFKGQKHAQLCIRNPLGALDIGAAWQEVRTKVQIFFGAGHPLSNGDFDTYMTIDRQLKLKAASYVVMYDFPAGDSRVGRSILSPGEVEQRAVVAEWKARKARVAR
jgi:hypothetical protein